MFDTLTLSTSVCPAPHMRPRQPLVLVARFPVLIPCAPERAGCDRALGVRGFADRLSL